MDAKIDGLRELVRSESSATRGMLSILLDVPEAVATLKAEVVALNERVDTTASKDEYDAVVQRVADLEEHAATQDDHAALAQRVSDLEGHRTLVLNWRAMAAISLMATLLGGFLGHLAHL